MTRPGVMVTRQLFWWGHDTIEDQAARQAAEKKAGLIAWTDPNQSLGEKKEFTWNPARIEAEAAFNVGLTHNMLHHADLMNWQDRNLYRGLWHTWLTDPVHFREKMREKHYRYLVVSQLFMRERLTTPGSLTLYTSGRRCGRSTTDTWWCLSCS